MLDMDRLTRLGAEQRLAACRAEVAELEAFIAEHAPPPDPRLESLDERERVIANARAEKKRRRPKWTPERRRKMEQYYAQRRLH